MKKIFTELAEFKESYHDTIDIMEGLPFCQYMQIKTNEFYSNSRYINGNKDGLNREIPFFNIVNFRVTLAKVATDLDIKDVQIESDNPEHYVESMLLQHEAYEWMKETNFGLFLNRMGYTRPKYGGVIVKRVEDSEGMRLEIPEWKNLWTDQVDTLSEVCERHYMTPVALAAKRGVWDDVDEAIEAMQKGKDKCDRLEVFELHGEFTKEVLDDANEVPPNDSEDADSEDSYSYSKQKYFLATIGKKQFVFLAEEEEESPYDYLAWEEMSGRGLGRGVIEDSEQAQIWINDAVINETNAMALAGKVVMKTTSTKVGNNILEIDNGRIFEMEANTDLEAVNLEPSALGEFQNQINRWKEQVSDATSSYDANTGETPPSGTPYSQTALLNQVASKPFDYRREEAGIFITRLFEKWVIPYLVKKIKKEHILVSDYSEEELEMIDESFATYQVNEKATEAIMSGKILSQEDYDKAIDGYKALLKGERRYLSIPKGYFDDVEAKVSVITTNEQRDKAAALTSLSTILKDVSGTFNPQTGTFAMLENPILSKIFGTIVELAGAGLSPVSLGIGKKTSSQPTATPPAQAPTAPTPPPIAPPTPSAPATASGITPPQNG